MTTGSQNNGGSRLDRIEEILAQTAIQTAANAQAIAANALAIAATEQIANSNARAIEANSNTMADNDARLTARLAEVAAEIDGLREVVLNFVDGIQVMNQRIDGQEDRFTEIVGQVRDLQVQNSRILNRLEGLESQD